MILELTLMGIAVGVMATLIVHKHLESTRGLTTSVHEMRQKTDPVLNDIRYTTGRVFSYVTLHNFVVVLHYAFVHVARWIMDVSHIVHKTSSSLVEKASKKTEDLSRRGASSFYMKQMKDAKESGGNGAEKKNK